MIDILIISSDFPSFCFIIVAILMMILDMLNKDSN